MPYLRVFYNAEGRDFDGVVTSTDLRLSGGEHAQLIIDANEWNHADQDGKEAIMLSKARFVFPEVNWEKASAIEIRSMTQKDFEKALPRIFHLAGLFSADALISRSSVIMEVPENFNFKEVLEDHFKQHQCGIEVIYVDCKTEAPQSIFAKMDEAGWRGRISSIDVDRANKAEKKVTSVLLIDHFSDLDAPRARMYIESVLKVNRDWHICGTKNIPIILTFSNDDGMGYLYRSDFNIYDERYWR